MGFVRAERWYDVFVFIKETNGSSKLQNPGKFFNIFKEQTVKKGKVVPVLN
jgi:hypothetical protein